MKKGLLLFLLALTLCGTVVFAAGSKEAPVAKKTTIQICLTDDREKWIDGVIMAYEKVRPDVVVEKIILSGGSADRQAKMTMMMQTPQTCPDIMNEDQFKINADSAAGYLYPLDEYINGWSEWDQYYDNVQEMGKAVDGKVYGIPLTVDVLGLWYSKQLLKDAGVPLPFEPKSWSDIIDAAKKIKALNRADTIPYFITVAKTFPERASMRLFQPLYNGTGNTVYNPETKKWVINRVAFMDVANYVNEICNIQKLAPPLDLGVQNQVESIIQQDLMKADKVGIWLSGNWMSRPWAPGMQYAWPEVRDKVGFAKIPTQYGQEPFFTSMSGGWTLAIPSLAKNKDEAWEFIKFANSQDSLLQMALMTSELTVRKDVAERKEYKDPNRLFVAEASEMLNYTKFRPSLDVYPQVSLLMTEAMESIGLNVSTPEKVYDTFIKSLAEIVGSKNLIILQ